MKTLTPHLTPNIKEQNNDPILSPYFSYVITLQDHILKVPINPKFIFRLNKYFYNSEQNGENNFVFGQNRNFL